MTTITIPTGEQVNIHLQPQDCTEDQWQILNAVTTPASDRPSIKTVEFTTAAIDRGVLFVGPSWAQVAIDAPDLEHPVAQFLISEAGVRLLVASSPIPFAPTPG